MPKARPPDFGQPKTPEDIVAILRAIAESGCTIIGGQAINIWSILLEKANEEPWRSSRPYTSMDADGLGDLASLKKLATALQNEGYAVEVQAAETPEQTRVNTGLILATSNRLNISINIVNQPRGLRPQEVVQTAQPVKFRGTTLKVLHPLLCVESKADCLVELPQDLPGEPRQDKKHLVLAIANLRVFLEKLGQRDPGGATRLADRIRGLAVHQLGITILQQHKIDVLDAVPWREWQQASDETLKGFGETYDEVVRERTDGIENEKKARDWIEQLKNTPAKSQAAKKADHGGRKKTGLRPKKR